MKGSKTFLILFLAALLLFGCAQKPAAATAAEAQKTPAAVETEAPASLAPTAAPAPTAIPEPTSKPTPEPAPEPLDPFAVIEEAEIAEGRHARGEDYSAPFRTHFIDTERIAVHFEDCAAYSAEALRTLAKAVYADVLAIGERTGETPRKITVYIVGQMLKECPVLSDDRVFCTAADIESGVYREALCGACCALPVPWKQIGLSEYVFGTVDESGLREYYADEAHAWTASCAAVYLLPEVAGEETAAAARKTAISLTAYLMEREGLDAIRTVASTAEVLPAWSAYLGLETPPVLPAGSEYAAAMTAETDRKYRCVLRAGLLTAYVENGSAFETADDLYRFVCCYYHGAELLLAEMREEIPQYAPVAEEHFSEPMEFVLFDRWQGSAPYVNTNSYTDGNRIHLRQLSHTWHELTHALLQHDDAVSYWWICEAIADHFSRHVLTVEDPDPDFPDDPEERLRYWVGENAEERVTAFYRKAFAVYWQVKTEDPSSQDGILNDHALYRAIGIVSFLCPGEAKAAGIYSVAAARGKTADSPETNGNAMIYQQAMVLFEYLCDLYGIETVFDAYMTDTPLEEVCGKPYAELYADCLAYLQDRYGDLLADAD